MGTLTIRNLDDLIKSRLRLRAAARKRSMEDEVRHILRAALAEPATPKPDLGARFSGLTDAPLPVPEREAVRRPPDFAGTSAATRRPSRKPATDAARTK